MKILLITLIPIVCLLFMGCGSDQPTAPPDETLAFVPHQVDEAIVRLEAFLEGEETTLRAFDPWPGHNEIEDGDMRLIALPGPTGRLVDIAVQFRNVSAWWVDSTWVNHVFPGGIYEQWPDPQCFPCLCYSDVPVISFAAGGFDVGHEPANAVVNATTYGGDMFGDDCGFDWGDPGSGPVWCVYADRYHPSTSSIRCGGFVVDASREGRELPVGTDCVPLEPGELPTDPPHLLPEDTWITFCVIQFEIAPNFSGPLTISLIWAVDEFNRFEEKTEEVVVNVPRGVRILPFSSRF
jgi:hypothetical protein